MALRLAATLAAAGGSPRVLLVGIGNGRNVAPLLGVGAGIDAIEPDADRASAAAVRFGTEPRVRIAHADDIANLPYDDGGFDAALSTHGLLHGVRSDVIAAIGAIALRLRRDAVFFTTLGSQRDSRYAHGTALAVGTRAPRSGSERGIAHAYFDEETVHAAFESFEIESLEEVGASEHVGRWAHTAHEADSIVHWFLRARKR